MDAVPVTLGQEFGGYAAQVREGARRVADDAPRPGPDPARRHRRRHRPEHPPRVRRARARRAWPRTPASPILPPADPFEAQANRDGLVEASGALKAVAVSLTKIANDLRWMGSGPRAGLGEIFLPELQKGSSIMPGKVNPVIPEVVCQVSAQVIGNDTAITIGGLQGNFELNVQIPLMARNLLQSIRLLTTACAAVRRQVRRRHRGQPRAAASAPARPRSPMATALNPFIGYDRATAIVKDAAASGRPLREVAREHGVEESVLDEALDLRKIAAGTPAESAWTCSCCSTSRASRRASSRMCWSSGAPRSTGSSWTRASRCPTGERSTRSSRWAARCRSTTTPSIPWLAAEKRLIRDGGQAGTAVLGRVPGRAAAGRRASAPASTPATCPRSACSTSS